MHGAWGVTVPGVKLPSMDIAKNTSGKDASNESEGYAVLLRHGQTVWSETGQYTGRTDIPLTGQGREQAKEAGQRLAKAFPDGFDSDCIFSSPLQRARQTAELAGFPDTAPLDEILEWDYGPAEGHRPQDVVASLGRDWKLWVDGPHALGIDELSGDRVVDLPSGSPVSVHVTQGESLDQVAARARGIVEWLEPLVCSGRHVLLVAHAHILRILTTQWLDLDPHKAQLFRMNTAHYGVLGIYQGKRVLRQWNV